MVLKSWRALPDPPLAALGPASELLLRAECRTYRAAAECVHALPYGRNSDRSDYMLVLPERRGTCSTKHALLAAVAREQALPVSLVIGIYDMTEANTPGIGEVLAAYGLESIPEAHCYLRYRADRVDITRPSTVPPAAIARFLEEWPIEPAQIGEYKVRLHRCYLERWHAERPEMKTPLEVLWKAREECIAALAAPAPAFRGG